MEVNIIWRRFQPRVSDTLAAVQLLRRLVRKIRVNYDAAVIRRQLEWERLHVVRHPDGNTSVHGVSMRAVIRWYNRQYWPREYGPELPVHPRRP